MTTTVVTQQVAYSGNTSAVIPTGGRNWNSGTCACFNDCGSCMLGYFCTPCYWCYISSRLGENCCAPVCAGPIPLRTKLRLILGIQGSICGDCCMLTWCGACTLCQMAREMKSTGLL